MVQNGDCSLSHFRNQLGFLLAVILIPLGVGYAATSDEPLAELRTPKPPDTPQIHGPTIYDARAGHPFLYRIPCTGIRPILFSAKNLPASLRLDSKSGIIPGEAPKKRGEYLVDLQAVNARGRIKRQFKIVVRDTIGLTPQMGWNDWYTFYDRITDGDIRRAAAAMISSGMADFGYAYVDIDDGWSRKPESNEPELKGPARDSPGNILSNARFPDMPALTGYIHELGLKTGIYTSPGPRTCAGFEGSYQHEEADALRFAQWGFDLLKYDWCSYGSVARDDSLLVLQEPYKKMGGLVEGLDRDVVFNMCQYGMGEVWKWGRQVGGNSWRTTGDLGTTPDSSLPGFYSIGLANSVLNEYARPGGWNDSDYILIGTVGDANNIALPARQTQLTAEEQYSCMSMWSLMASPLMFSGDMTALDEFTRNVLCNSEVIDIDWDSLGMQGIVIRKADQEFILAKPLDDGSLAVGLFNLTAAPRVVSVGWKELGVRGQQKVRDVWRQRNIGSFASVFSSQVPSHGVVLVRLIPKSAQQH